MAQAKFEILTIFLGERRNTESDAGQVDALMLTQQPAMHDIAFHVTPANRLVVRYRLDDSTSTNRFTEADVRLGTPERAHDLIRRDQDLGIIDTHVLGAAAFNELRVLFGRRFVDLNVDAHCGLTCPAENRPSILLGKSNNLPQRRTEDRWQLADTFSRTLNHRTGQHMLKAGVDVSVIRDANFFPLNLAGVFKFETDRPFDADDPATYPVQFNQSTGSPDIEVDDTMYASSPRISGDRRRA